MDWASITFAFSAGMLAFLSPCAFPLLPAYISYYLGLEEAPGKTLGVTSALRKGLLGGLVCAAGAIAVLGLIGIGVAALGRAITPYIPAMELVVGVGLILLGVLTLLGTVPRFHPKIGARMKRGHLSLFGFGALYALASAGCVAPIFIGVILSALSTGGFIGGLAVFLAYVIGLSVLLIGVTVLVACAKEAAMIEIKRAMPYVERVGALILILVGIYLTCYYLTVFY